jgi:hypothetical protein
MNDHLQTAAARVAAKRRELEQRLEDLAKAHPLRKMEHAPLVIAAFYELLDHQSQVNAAAIARILELEHRTELLAAKAGCAFATMPAGG